MFARFLMVCVGNICRSPMAEALFAQRLSRRAVKGARVESAGIGAEDGHPAAPIAQELMRERGLDLSDHRSRLLTQELLADFELVLVMEERLKKAVEHAFPASRGRVQAIGRFGKFDVLDPWGGPRADYERALSLIERGLDDYEKALWSSPP